MKQQRIASRIPGNAFKGPERFYFFLDKVAAMLQSAARQKNPAGWLYKNNVRTPFFMLEGLCKLYAELHNRKRFTKLKELFKKVEDLLGTIDYYDAFAQEFTKNPKIPATIVNYLKSQRQYYTETLHTYLVDKEWIGSRNRRITKVKDKLADASWLGPATEIKAIHEYYVHAVVSIKQFIQETGSTFDNVETDLHELRRKLRWLSIYPQALQGAIQLSPAARNTPHSLQKYITKAITTSPFNTLPPKADLHAILFLDRQRFYALSWMIAELGRLKDSGLKVLALKEALEHTQQLTEEDATKKAYSLLGKKQLPIDELLAQASGICKTYFKEKHLDALVGKISVDDEKG